MIIEMLIFATGPKLNAPANDDDTDDDTNDHQNMKTEKLIPTVRYLEYGDSQVHLCILSQLDWAVLAFTGISGYFKNLLIFMYLS